jgi:hypothetical protein
MIVASNVTFAKETQMRWQVVDDRFRGDPDGFDAIAAALIEGRTIHVTEVTNSEISSWYTRLLQRTGRRLRRRMKGSDPSEGYIVWLPETRRPEPDPQE